MRETESTVHLVIYSYGIVRGHGLQRVNAFWETLEDTRREIHKFRRKLISKDRTTPIPVMKILKFDNVVINRKVIVRLLTDLDDAIPTFIGKGEIVESISLPQVSVVS